MTESSDGAFIVFQESKRPAIFLLAVGAIALLVVGCSKATPVPPPTATLPFPGYTPSPVVTQTVKTSTATLPIDPMSLGCAAFDDELSRAITEISVLSITTIPAISVLADEGTGMTREEYESILLEVADTLVLTTTLSSEIASRPAPNETLEGLLYRFTYRHKDFVDATLLVLKTLNGPEADLRLPLVERNIASAYYLNASRDLLEESARCRESEGTVW